MDNKDVKDHSMTNEEWFDTLPTEEKAKVLWTITHKAWLRGVSGELPISLESLENLLKEKHDG